MPYAAPPVGERRFVLPQPPTPWEGVRDATTPGPNAPQAHRPFEGLDAVALVGKGWEPGDDYLTLNVWAPDDDATGRPVMVFIHGGGFVIGSKDAPVTDGAAFARSGVICIAINYRLGIEGFLPIPGATSNLGLHDQICALQWVQRNAAAFGGDPANVTVFGESAGGMSIANLIASPLSKGLFRRGIIQSGHGSLVRPVEVAMRLTRRLAKMLRVTPDVAGFASRSVEECLAAVDKVQLPTTLINLRDAHKRDPAFGLTRFVPVTGDELLPLHPLDALAKGAGAEVELMIGTNREEMNLYFVPTGVRRRINRVLAWFFVRMSEPKARIILKAYGAGQPGRTPGDVFSDALHDIVFRLPARHYAAAHQGRTHVYEFDWRSPACEGELGACHGLELPFVFNTLASATGPKGIAGTSPPQALADRVHEIWLAFATDGQLPWPAYDAATRQVFQLKRGMAVTDPDMPAAAVWP